MLSARWHEGCGSAVMASEGCCLTVNVLGSFLMALIAEYFALRAGLPQSARLFLTTGVLGGFTTFSAFSLDTLALWERGQGLAATGYVAATLVFSLGAFVAGLALMRSLVKVVA